MYNLLGKLKEIRYQSFYLKKELISELNIIYLVQEDGCLHCDISEGKATIKETKQPPLLNLDHIKDEFKYPITKFEDILTDQLIGFKITQIKIIKEDQWDRVIKISFENNQILEISESNDGSSEMLINIINQSLLPLN
jgi:hypothetical protein